MSHLIKPIAGAIAIALAAAFAASAEEVKPATQQSTKTVNVTPVTQAMLDKAGIKAPPKTWAELVAQAKIIKQKGIVKFPIVWSWAQAEALICDYTTLVAAYKGDFFAGGKPVFDEAMADFAEAYAEQNDLDYRELRRAVDDGRITVQEGL